MDRKIVYPAQIPLVEDQLEQTRFIQKAFGFMAQALAGEGGTIATGLDCAPASGMTITVAPGQVITPGAVDSTSYGVLAEDTTSILTQFLLTDAATLTVPGVGATYLIYAAPSVSDQSNLVLPFYNSANPTQVYAGPDNNGASSATVRASILTVGIGTSIPSGAVPLWQIVVPSGATAITSAMISAASGAPLYPSLAATAPRTLAPFNAALAADFGGYPLNAIVADASTSGLYWRSTVGGNTTVPGAAGSSWTNFLGGYAVLNGGNTFTGVQIVPAVTDWTAYQAVGAKDADARYVTNQAAIGGGTGITSAIIDGTTSAPSFLDSDGAWHVVQPHGDYATNTALSQEASARADAVATLQTNINNEATAREDADALKANLSGGNSFTGTQTVNGDLAVGVNSGWSGGTTTGSGRWANGHIGFGSPDGNLETYTGYLQVTDLLGSPGDNYSGMNLYGYNYAGTRTDYTFSWNGRITTPLGLVAVQSDLAVASTDLVQHFTASSVSSGSRVTFPVAFSGTPVVIAQNLGTGDDNCHTASADAGGFTLHINLGGSSDISVIAIGPR